MFRGECPEALNSTSRPLLKYSKGLALRRQPHFLWTIASIILNLQKCLPCTATVGLLLFRTQLLRIEKNGQMAHVTGRDGSLGTFSVVRAKIKIGRAHV